MKRRSSDSKDKEGDKGKRRSTETRHMVGGEAGEAVEVLYAIRDARNTHGGARVGTWKELSDNLAKIPDRFKKQFTFSEKDQKTMEQKAEQERGQKSYIGTDAHNEAAKWALGENRATDCTGT